MVHQVACRCKEVVASVEVLVVVALVVEVDGVVRTRCSRMMTVCLDGVVVVVVGAGVVVGLEMSWWGRHPS